MHRAGAGLTEGMLLLTWFELVHRLSVQMPAKE